MVAATALVGSISLLLAACAGSSGDSAAESGGGGLAPDKGSVTILTWEGYHDQAMLDAYSEQSGVKVTQITAGSVDEMFAKAQSSQGQIDLVYFDLGNVDRYYKAGMLQPLDPSQVPNVTNISPGLPWEPALTVDGQIYGLPYNWGTLPLCWSKEAFPTAPTSWKVLWDPAYQGKVSIPDDSYLGIPMVALAQGINNPYDLDDAGFAEVKSGLESLRPQVKTLTAGFNDQANMFASGDAVVGYCQNIAVVNELNADGDKYAYGFPTEGTPFWVDSSMMMKGANRQEVYDFINHTLEIPWQTKFIEATGSAGVISYEEAAKTVPEDVLAKSEIVNLQDPNFWEAMKPMVAPNRMDERIALWNEFKAGF
jgi:spermidine/putrescine transport system substrate-binding protein